MSIELHCPGCSKLIRAPENAGGKTGKCPYCERKVYIPMPLDESDAIPLAPIDPSDEARDAEMRRESTQYAAGVDHGGEPPPASLSSEFDGGLGTAGLNPTDVVDLDSEVRKFIACMHVSKLDEADQVVIRLKKTGQRAQDFVQGTMLDELPLAVEGVPPPLVQGFLKALMARLS